jgi:hypothetical protein
LPSERPASQLSPRRLSWLWPGRLALGKLAVLDGDPELGKSLLTLDLCARLSTGRPWPDDQPGAAPAAALVLNAEDDTSDTLRPRLQALGADLDRVFLLPPLGPDQRLTLALPGRIAPLAAALCRTQARLLVIEPVTAFLDQTVNTSNDASVRRALAPLLALAESAACAVLLVRHLSKTGGRRALYRGLGSIGLVATCRSAWLVAPDACQPHRRILAQLKNNLAPPQPSLAFEIRTTADGLPVLAWLGAVEWTADALLDEARRRSGPRDTGRAFLLEFLHDGPRTCQDIWTAGQKKGLNSRTLQRARTDLDILPARVFEGGKTITYWLLPGQLVPPPVPNPPDDDPVQAFFELMGRSIPPPSPLEHLPG